MKTKPIYVVRLGMDVAVYKTKPKQVTKRKVKSVFNDSTYTTYDVEGGGSMIEYFCYTGFRQMTGIRLTEGQMAAIRPASVRFVSAKNGKPPRTGRSAR